MYTNVHVCMYKTVYVDTVENWDNYRKQYTFKHKLTILIYKVIVNVLKDPNSLRTNILLKENNRFSMPYR